MLSDQARLGAPISTARRRGEIRAFTGLRGCAAAMVMFYHFNAHKSASSSGGFIISNGYLWVDAFFVLSGFVMAYTYGGEIAGGGWSFYWTFLMRRIARVYPLYIAVILESAGVALWRSHGHDIAQFTGALLANLAMVQAWGVANSFEGDTWSISTEWMAYLVFPFLLAATLFTSRRVALLSGLVAIATIALIATSPGPFTYPFQSRRGPLDIYSAATLAPLLRCLADFTLGLLSFRASRIWARDEFKGAGLVSAITAATILGFMAQPGYDVAVVATFPVLFASLAAQRGVVSFVLSSAFPIWLGERSYSVYLIHDKFSHLEEVLRGSLAQHTLFAAVIAQAVVGAVVLFFASAAYLWIEKPCRMLLRFYTSDKAPSAGRIGEASAAVRPCV